MLNSGFEGALTAEMADELRRRCARGREAVLTATTLAASGHPGGSFSSMELFTVLAGCANVRPDEPRWSSRDRLVVSHGHASPGFYVALALAGFFPVEEVEAHFRQAGSPFEGHVERMVPGVEWSTGNLGQGLSAGVGFAIASRLTGSDWRTYVAMSDAEQHKGQVAEARRLAIKQGLRRLTVVVDLNGVQISGHTRDIMPVRVAEDWSADGWRVVEVDGHDVEALYAAIAEAPTHSDAPTCVVAHTTLGKGVSFMEDQPEFHGRGLTEEEYAKAMAELNATPDLAEARSRRVEPCLVVPQPVEPPTPVLQPSAPRTYAADKRTDNRSAWGSALLDLAEANAGLPMAVLDCDLQTSVKTEAFAAAHPESFIECGVGEHNAATVAGALSISDVSTFWADFGVFGIDEVYNQQRLNDINAAGLKLVLTHCGLDVGEDGRTHHCIDYAGALRNFFGWKVIVPADPNQTDRATRAMVTMAGCVALAMGRSKLPIIVAEDGQPLFAGSYEFRYGDMVWARRGGDVCVLAMGTVAGAAVEAADALRAEGISAACGITASPLALDESAMRTAAESPLLVTVEDHNAHTGLGASVAEWLAENRATTRLLRLGVREYSTSGSAEDLLERADLDAAGIARSVRAALG